MREWTGKRVWITGASSGIGEAVARAFWAKGCHLILSARRAAELQRVADSLPASAAQRCFCLPMDVAETERAAEHAATVENAFGGVDVLVHCAGVSQRSWTVETPLTLDRKIMEINYFGTIALTKAVLPMQLRAGGGTIVVLSSISGKFGFYLRSAYSASKHALHGFFESLRMETFKQGIQVMMVCPGKIRTDISLHALGADGKPHGSMDAALAAGRDPGDLARAIIRGLEKGTEELYFGGKEMKAIWVRQYFPRLFSRLIRKQKPE